MRFSESSNQINQDIYNENLPLTKLPSNYCFDGIDLIKFICAFLVCIIHIHPLSTEGLLYSNYINFGFQQYICRIAVPFYFMASGFLLFRKIDLTNIDTNRIQKYCFKILRLLGTWTLLLVVGWTGHLWYLGALVVAVVLISVLLKYHIKFKYIALLSILLYIIGLLGDSYHGIIEPLKNINIFSFIFSGYEYFFSTTRNGVFMGFIFVLMGALFAHNKILLNLKSAVLCFSISMLLLLVEVFMLQYFSNPKDHNMYISLIPATFFLFYIATHIKLNNRPIYRKLRVMGMLIFYSHLLVNQIIELLFSIINKIFNVDLSGLSFIATIMAVTVFSYLVEWLSHKEKFKWLKYLYS